jgi:hypothetical protein
MPEIDFNTLNFMPMLFNTQSISTDYVSNQGITGFNLPQANDTAYMDYQDFDWVSNTCGDGFYR